MVDKAGPTPTNLKLYALRTNKGTISEELEFEQIFHSVDEVYLGPHMGAVLVCNPTSLHLETVAKLKDLACSFFIEKPLSNKLDDIQSIESLFDNKKNPCMLGYHVLFHPCFVQIKDAISRGEIGEIVSCKAYNGSYLPDWHPWEDYKNSYASNKSLGGGVTLTMIHELNYLTNLFGKSKKCFAMKTEKEILGIDVDEGIEILIKHDTGVVSNIHLNFFQKTPERWLKIVGSKGSIYWNFWSSELSIGDKTIKFDKSPIELLDLSYYDEIRHFLAICSANRAGLPVAQLPGTTLSDGIEDVKTAIKILETAI
jgi:predicted dehydrogenase